MTDRIKVLEKFEQQKEYTKSRVEAGIEQNRKGTVLINVTQDGKPVSNAKIRLKQKTHEFKYGANLFMLDEMETEEKNKKYREYFKDCFNMATLPFYWSDLEPEKGKQRYEKGSPKIYRRPPIDLCIEFCEENGIEPREHGLAYDFFFPKWLSKTNLQENKRELERRFKEISERYADKINTIEVTNEHEWPLRGMSPLYASDDYLEFCYSLAEKYFPTNELVINEGTDLWHAQGTQRDKYYAIIENTLLKGKRIDAIGMQFHMFFGRDIEYKETRLKYDPQCLFRMLDLYSKLNKPLQITEITIPAYSNDAEDEEIQAKIIENLYSIWFSHPNVEQIIYWNLVDGYAAFAPMGDMTAGENYFYSGLIRHDMTPKPAYYKVKELFEKKWHTDAVITTDEDGKTYFRGFYGKYDVEVEKDGKTYTNEISLSKNYFDYDGIKIEL